jgi:hypothetical protein
VSAALSTAKPSSVAEPMLRARRATAECHLRLGRPCRKSGRPAAPPSVAPPTRGWREFPRRSMVRLVSRVEASKWIHQAARVNHRLPIERRRETRPRLVPRWPLRLSGARVPADESVERRQHEAKWDRHRSTARSESDLGEPGWYRTMTSHTPCHGHDARRHRYRDGMALTAGAEINFILGIAQCRQFVLDV